mgnify:CR=1 FL=1
MNKLTNRGNIKNKSDTNEVLIDKRSFKIFKYWKKQIKSSDKNSLINL